MSSQNSFWMRVPGVSILVAIIALGTTALGGGWGPCGPANWWSLYSVLAFLLSIVAMVISISVMTVSATCRTLRNVIRLIGS
jgi:hypothetical protein